MIRAFVGIGLAPHLAQALAPLACGLPGARWTDPANFHVTLVFLGNLTRDQLADVDAQLSLIRHPGFALHVRGLGTFGRTHPHTLWAGVEDDPVLTGLHVKTQAAADNAGIETETRRYTPHVTLARLSQTSMNRLQSFIAGNSPFEVGQQVVDRFTLFESVTAEAGPVYRPLAEYFLEV